MQLPTLGHEGARGEPNFLFKWIIPEKIHTLPTEDIHAIWKGRRRGGGGGHLLLIIGKCTRISGEGLDVFWDDTK